MKRLRLFEITVMRNMFGSKWGDLTGEWRRLDNEPHDLYSALTITWVIKSRQMTSAGRVAQTAEQRGAYRVLVGKFEGKKLVGTYM